MQCALVVKHIKHYHPDWQVDVEAKEGSHYCFYGVADNTYVMGTDRRARPKDYDKVMTLPFPRPKYANCYVPNTKVTRCLEEYFDDCQPIPELYQYEINITDESRELVERYVSEELGGKPFAILHYQGISSPDCKNLEDCEAQMVTDMMRQQDLIPVLLCWKPHNLQNVTNPGAGHWLWRSEGSNGKQGGASTIAALAEHAQYWCGIDSGPEHVMAATDTPGYIFWTYHHPVHCFDFGKNVTHIVPPDIDIAAENQIAQEYFLGHYPHHVFSGEYDYYNFTEWLDKATLHHGWLWEKTAPVSV